MQKEHVGLSWSAATQEIARHVDEVTLVDRWVFALHCLEVFCEPVQPRLPQSRERFRRYIPALMFVLFLLKQQPRHWRQVVPKKTLAFCCCALSCIWNSKELVCSKMEKVGSKSNETLQVQSCSRRSLKMRPHCYGRTKLDMPALKPHDNFVLPYIDESKHTWFFLT